MPMKRPFIIGVGGTCCNSGRTTTAVLLLKFLAAGSRQQATERVIEDNDTGLSAFIHPKPCGSGKREAIKYTKTELYASLVDGKVVLSGEDKNTGKFIDA